ncbi:FAD dependent sulfhydryl oxidase Erv1 [Penicillium hordei]|uniref:Sulfhydryl oxidase n=1 Tax=Penicillium hordei TaxID=40994 RepID=A0AAD6GUT2_9EURO|nr:FAD dependent sulfhydryl oxidase Erv1 [Penicillium hordei]KAJ5592561.1 FAD dependent sulfhydryl oxidase Erv1 [Penicillium hordei]
MSSAPPEQVNSQYKGTASMFSHQNPATSASSSKPAGDDDSKAPLPKGVVLDKDGKPCRTCTSVASWRALTKQADHKSTNSSSASTPTSSTSKMTTSTPALAAAATPSPSETPSDCPPDVEELGRSTWTLLHSMAATYPEKANMEHQANMSGFLKFFAKLYPCWVCADDFQTWMAHPSGRNQPKLESRKEFGWWMCEAHNEVNRKLGKKEFDCRLWEERWRTGWKDGRCD